MKKVFLSASVVLLSLSSFAQVKVSEPEFVGSYYLLTSNSTTVRLPKEIGEIKEHKNKASLFSKVAGTVANVGSSVGVAGAMLGNSYDALKTGLGVASTAMAAGSVADAVGVLGGASGMDIVLQGKSSDFRWKNGDVRIVVKAENNAYDPADIYRVVAFKTSKKERRMQWFEISSALLGGSEAKKKGYIPFEGKKYGETSYLLTIPSAELPKGEYGIVLISNPTVQVATFGIDK